MGCFGGCEYKQGCYTGGSVSPRTFFVTVSLSSGAGEYFQLFHALCLCMHRFHHVWTWMIREFGVLVPIKLIYAFLLDNLSLYALDPPCLDLDDQRVWRSCTDKVDLRFFARQFVSICIWIHHVWTWMIREIGVLVLIELIYDFSLHTCYKNIACKTRRLPCTIVGGNSSFIFIDQEIVNSILQSLLSLVSDELYLFLSKKEGVGGGGERRSCFFKCNRKFFSLFFFFFLIFILFFY